MWKVNPKPDFSLSVDLNPNPHLSSQKPNPNSLRFSLRTSLVPTTKPLVGVSSILDELRHTIAGAVSNHRSPVVASALFSFSSTRRCCCCVDDVVASLPVMGRTSSLVVRPLKQTTARVLPSLPLFAVAVNVVVVCCLFGVVVRGQWCCAPLLPVPCSLAGASSSPAVCLPCS
ncbi:hypothetical protein BVRB_1g010390 [Beta vulgaris subsp. vulgaris]|nr:hypothetical protein BVRB_1g010390 [Beta vulgaris subsp. vulgaris]